MICGLFSSTYSVRALHLTAHWFGFELDEVGWDQEVALSERDVQAPLFSLKKGTVSAIRFISTAMCAASDG